MMRMREGTPLRSSDITRFENPVTTVTDKAMTMAGLSCTVTASAEQIPRICTMTGLFAENGPVRNFMFLAENKGSFSFLLIVFYIFFVRLIPHGSKYDLLDRGLALGFEQRQVVFHAVVEHRRHAVRGLRTAGNGVDLMFGVLSAALAQFHGDELVAFEDLLADELRLIFRRCDLGAQTGGLALVGHDDTGHGVHILSRAI